MGRTLYAALLEELTERGFVQAFAGITLPNAASVALHEACGFRARGVERAVGFKLGSWHDVGWWQRTLRVPPLDPSPSTLPGSRRVQVPVGEAADRLLAREPLDLGSWEDAKREIEDGLGCHPRQ